MNGPHHREVLEAHLRRPVLADRDAGVRAREPEVRAADRRHPDEVVRPREEGGERRSERDLAEHLHADGHADHVLLGDVALDEPFGSLRLEVLGVGGVRDLGVDHDDVRAGGERGERLTERLAGGDRLGVLGEPDGAAVHRGRHRGLRLADRDPDVTRTAELGDRSFGLVGRERLAVPALGVLEERDPVALLRLRDHDRGTTAPSASRYAPSIASTSCPSTITVCHPKAPARAA